MKKILTLKEEIKATQIGSKVEYDGFMTRVLFRPSSYYFAAFLYKLLGFSPNSISLLSGFLGILVVFIAYVYPNLLLISIILYAIACLDNADGALARYLKRNNPLGAIADALGGYIIMFTSPLLCWVILNKWNRFDSAEYHFLGLITLFIIALEFLGRTMKLKLTTIHTNNKEKSKPPTFISSLRGNLNFCGFMFPFYILAWSFNYPVLAWIYAIIFSGTIGTLGITSTLFYVFKNTEND